ncbi:hypothetical protein J2S10_002316 [Neobacillus ginsengisoli]|uniref:Uncharacterized protein n=1 Tax=Neobacillus ginsengisoli TaxID=904295 RepID=A0ABT9XUC2_9BACI|nr:hypothetical protein [Neobacillus ginsengisoli]
MLPLFLKLNISADFIAHIYEKIIYRTPRFLTASSNIKSTLYWQPLFSPHISNIFIILLDSNKMYTVQPEDLYYRHQHSSYVGGNINCRVTKTFVLGCGNLIKHYCFLRNIFSDKMKKIKKITVMSF